MFKRKSNHLIIASSTSLVVAFFIASCGTPNNNASTATTVPPSDAISTIANVKRAVVRIEAFGLFVDQNNAASAQPEEGDSFGSGFVVSKDGLVVTNNHVVAGATKVQVNIGDDEKVISAKILGRSECSDLAVLQLANRDGDYDYLDWYEGDPDVNLEVRAAGFPLGDPNFTLTNGIVSKAKADGNQPWASVEKTIEHTARINPGNSGGPLVDLNAKVVAINYAGGTTEENQGQYFSINSSLAQTLVPKLQKGDVESLGLNSEVISSDDGSESGLFVSSITAGSPAEDVGILPGDVVLQLENQTLGEDGTMRTYCNIVRKEGTDAKLQIRLYRPSSDSYFTGILNSGAKVEEAVSLSDKADAASTGIGTTASENADFSDYTLIADQSNTISMEVPAGWNKTFNGKFASLSSGMSALDGEPQILATTDIDAFVSTLDGTTSSPVAGVSIVGSSKLGSGSTETLVRSFSVGSNCTEQSLNDYSDQSYEGKFVVYACVLGATKSVIVVAALQHPSNDFGLLMFATATNTQEVNSIDHMLATVKDLA